MRLQGLRPGVRLPLAPSLCYTMPWPPWIFIHGTDIVDIGLIVLFFGLFCYFRSFFRCLLTYPTLPLPLWKRLINAIFRSFFTIFRYFFRCSPPPGNFYADALEDVRTQSRKI